MDIFTGCGALVLVPAMGLPSLEAVALTIGVASLVISLYAASHARRAAAAAASSARSAQEDLKLQREAIREHWIRELATALPDDQRVTRLLGDLPSWLRADWRSLLTSAAGRNPRTPDGYFLPLLEKKGTEWQRAALPDRPTLEDRT